MRWQRRLSYSSFSLVSISLLVVPISSHLKRPLLLTDNYLPKMIRLLFSFLTALLWLPSLASAQTHAKTASSGVVGPLLNVSHADPSVFNSANGTWCSFVDAQTVEKSMISDIRGPWVALPDYELNFPNVKWTIGSSVGAPQVNQLVCQLCT